MENNHEATARAFLLLYEALCIKAVTRKKELLLEALNICHEAGDRVIHQIILLALGDLFVYTELDKAKSMYLAVYALSKARSDILGQWFSGFKLCHVLHKLEAQGALDVTTVSNLRKQETKNTELQQQLFRLFAHPQRS